MIDVIEGFEFACEVPGCGTRSPALRSTWAQAEEDERAHMNIVHEDDREPHDIGPERIEP